MGSYSTVFHSWENVCPQHTWRRSYMYYVLQSTAERISTRIKAHGSYYGPLYYKFTTERMSARTCTQQTFSLLGFSFSLSATGSSLMDFWQHETQLLCNFCYVMRYFCGHKMEFGFNWCELLLLTFLKLASGEVMLTIFLVVLCLLIWFSKRIPATISDKYELLIHNQSIHNRDTTSHSTHTIFRAKYSFCKH